MVKPTRLIAIAALILLALIRWLLPERSLDTSGPRALVDAGFALGLLAIILLLSASVGLKILTFVLKLNRNLTLRVGQVSPPSKMLNQSRLSRPHPNPFPRGKGTKPPPQREGLWRGRRGVFADRDGSFFNGELTPLELAVFSPAVGLGVLAYGVMALGLIGQLRLPLMLGWLAVMLVWAGPEWGAIIEAIPIWWQSLRSSWRRLRFEKKLLLSAVGLIFGLTLLQALVPPWNYDGLMYHLRAVDRFLATQRIPLMPDLWQANGPFTIQMLYAVGLGLGSDVFAKLLHLSCAVLLITGTFAFARRFVSHLAAWISVAVLLGIPIFPIWAGGAYADMAWALFEFLAVYAISLWVLNGSSRYLLLGGLLAGFALGSKYLALAIGAALGLWVLWHSRAQGWRGVAANGLRFGLPAGLIGSPWYLKNLFLSGNPVYPLVFGGPGWEDPLQLQLLDTFLRSFGTGQSLAGFFLLPVSIYTERRFFVTAMGGLDWPSILFPLLFLYPWVRKSTVLNGVMSVIVVRVLFWATGSQQSRFLLPLYPLFAVFAAKILIDLTSTPLLKRWQRIIFGGLLGANILVATLTLLIFIFVSVQPLGVITGFESKREFLRRYVPDYIAVQQVMEELSPEDRVLFMWNGMGYYCDQRCVPDPGQFQWTYIVLTSSFEQTKVVDNLHRQGISHLLLSLDDANFILPFHDPTKIHQQALDFFQQEFRLTCTNELYRDNHVILYELTCPSSDNAL